MGVKCDLSEYMSHYGNSIVDLVVAHNNFALTHFVVVTMNFTY